LLALHFTSGEFWRDEHWRPLGFSSPGDFVTGFLEGAIDPMDAGDLLTQAWKWQQADVSRHTEGDLAAALGRITAKTFVLPISSDQVFPTADCAAEQALVPDSELRVIHDVFGHISLFGLSPSFSEQVDGALRDLWAAA
jgi:homoserine O-acetyltransferase